MANYRYNDVELPELPEYDKTIYPYAFIGKYLDKESHYLYLSDQPFTYTGTGKETGTSISFDTAKWYKTNNSGWEIVSESTTNIFTLTAYFTGSVLGEAIWANHDIINENDNSVYLPASDPVPVDGEPVTGDFYRCMGGAWVKQAAHKSASSAWAKQDAYRLS